MPTMENMKEVMTKNVQFPVSFANKNAVTADGRFSNTRDKITMRFICIKSRGVKGMFKSLDWEA